MLIFLICSLVLCWYAGETFPTVMSPWSLHKYITFYHKMLGGTKYIMSPPVQKLGGPRSLHPGTPNVKFWWNLAGFVWWDHQILQSSTGPALSRLDRLLPLGPRAKGGPALCLLLAYVNLHFQSKLLVYRRPGTQWRFYGVAWRGHAPPRFFRWPPVGPPVFFGSIEFWEMTTCYSNRLRTSWAFVFLLPWYEWELRSCVSVIVRQQSLHPPVPEVSVLWRKAESKSGRQSIAAGSVHTCFHCCGQDG